MKSPFSDARHHFTMKKTPYFYTTLLLWKTTLSYEKKTISYEKPHFTMKNTIFPMKNTLFPMKKTIFLQKKPFFLWKPPVLGGSGASAVLARLQQQRQARNKGYVG
jgi:hypothetical protein